MFLQKTQNIKLKVVFKKFRYAPIKILLRKTKYGTVFLVKFRFLVRLSKTKKRGLISFKRNYSESKQKSQYCKFKHIMK